MVKAQLPFVAYRNNTLMSCELISASLRLNKGDAAPPPSWWVSWSQSSVLAVASCAIDLEAGSVMVMLSAEYDGRGDRVYDYVLVDDIKRAASVWWGTRLLNAYWTGVLTTMARIPSQNNSVVNHTVFNFKQQTGNGEQESVSELSKVLHNADFVQYPQSQLL